MALPLYHSEKRSVSLNVGSVKFYGTEALNKFCFFFKLECPRRNVYAVEV